MTVKFSSSVFKRFQRLQWRLTISYLVTSVLVLCLLELLVTLISVAVTVSQEKDMLERHAQLIARSAGPAFPASGAIGQRQFQALWELLQERDPAWQGYLAAIDARGQVMVAAGDHAPAVGSDLRPGLSASVRRAVQEALSSRPASSLPRSDNLSTFFEQGSVYVVAPLLQEETFRGAMSRRSRLICSKRRS